MPSGARRRKAAQKKKNQKAAIDDGVERLPEGDEDLKAQEQRDTDSSGETGSPVSRDQHYPFGKGGDEYEKGILGSGSAPIDSVDESIKVADGDDCVVDLEVNDGEDRGETGQGAANANQVIVEIDETESSSVRHDLQELPDEETNGNGYSDYLKNECQGDVDGVEKVCAGIEESDSEHLSGKDDDFSFLLKSQNKDEEIADGNAFDAHQSAVLPYGSVEVANGAGKENASEVKGIDGEGLGLSVNFEEEMKKDFIAELSLPIVLADQDNLLPEATSTEAAPLSSTSDRASLLQNNDVSEASPLKGIDDSGTVILKERKESFSSAVNVVSQVDIPNWTKNEADDKLLPIGFEKMGLPEDGLESILEDNRTEKHDSMLANGGTGPVLKENRVTKLENGSDMGNLAANGDEALLKENGHGDAPITEVVLCQNCHCKEKNDDQEGVNNNIDDHQDELPKLPRVVRKTSWTGCCGLFDVITGSVR